MYIVAYDHINAINMYEVNRFWHRVCQLKGYARQFTQVNHIDIYQGSEKTDGFECRRGGLLFYMLKFLEYAAKTFIVDI